MNKFPIKIVILFSIAFLNIGIITIKSQSNACNRSVDSLELIKFYQNYDGNHWIDKTNWLINGKSINTWKGVKLNAQGCVISLALPNNNLVGNLIDPKIENLKVLNLSKNKIEGPILDFKNMPLLDTLILSENKISGSLPDFKNLSTLDNLDLSLNEISGNLPDFSNFPNIGTIILDDNHISGEIPDFNNMKKLNTLWLWGNSLSGKIPDFSNLPELGSFYINRNKFEGNVPVFTKIPKMWFLGLGENKFSGTIPEFVNMPKLFQLDISDCNLSGPIPSFNLPNLATLYLRINHLTGPFPDLSKCNKIGFIDLGTNELSGSIPDMSNYPNLSSVWIGNNNFSGPIPNTPFIKWFIFSRNQFTFSDILASGQTSPTYYYYPQKDFYYDTSIQIQKNNSLSIDLKIDNDLKDNIYKVYILKNDFLYFQWQQDSNKIVFKNPQAAQAGRYIIRVTNPRLPSLILSSKTISLRVCDTQKDSNELVKLYNSTGGTNWTNNTNWLVPNKPFNTWYGIKTNNLGCIQKIDLSDNNLKGNLPLLDLNTLDTAIFENNQIDGAIPDLKIPFIKVLNLSQNLLTGELPIELNNWNNIQNLNVSKNQLEGGVPPDLGDLCDLRSLRVNDNKLTGELPDRLTMLTNLQIGEVDFGNNDIDSLNNKMIWFCPFGDSIFRANPSYDRFLGICNVKCNGNEFQSLKDFPWIVDTIEKINCKNNNCELTEAHSGFVDVRGVKVFYTFTRCYTTVGPPSIYDDEVKFYDCGGHLLERVTYNSDKNFNTSYGAMNIDIYSDLKFDILWRCGQILNLNTDTKDQRPKYKESEFIKDFKIACSPNPSSEWVVCDLSEFKLNNSVLKISNYLGQNFTAPYTMSQSQLELNVSNLEGGMYIISIWSDNQFYTSKMIIQK